MGIKPKLYADYRGRTQSLRAWAEELSVVYETLLNRYLKGMRGDDLFQPVTYKGAGIKTIHGNGRRGGHQSKLYSLWAGIKYRCNNPDHKHYARYGGRGITMHKAWVDDFFEFEKAVGLPPSTNHSLDRIDNNKGYEPGNVQWATRRMQANNRSDSLRITYANKTLTLKEWADLLELPYMTLYARYKRGKRDMELFGGKTYKRRT